MFSGFGMFGFGLAFGASGMLPGGQSNGTTGAQFLPGSNWADAAETANVTDANARRP